MSESKRAYLVNAELDRQLAADGFVVIPFLDATEVEALKKVYADAHADEQVPFYATAHHQDSEFRKKMSNAISAILKPQAERAFLNCDLLGASFIVKAANSESSLQPHQDWNIVDENKFRSFNVWIPLVDLTEKNGAIEVLPKSHEWVRGYRHSSINCAYREVHDLVWENMKPLYMNAGQALIYDHSLLHASKANNSAENRIAVASGVKPNEAQMYFYWNNHGMLEQYESNTEFFMTENIFEGPGNLKKVAQFGYDFPVVSAEQFHAWNGTEAPVMQDEILPAPQVVSEPEPSQPFWKVYTPMNIIREINYRLSSNR